MRENGYVPEEAREGVEERVERELIEEIIRDAGVSVHADFGGGYRTINSDRRTPEANLLFEQNLIGNIAPELGFNPTSSLRDQGIHEAVRLETAITQPKYEMVPTPVQIKGRGLFGRTKTVMENKRTRVGDEPLKHNQLISNGLSEPAGRLRYFAMGLREHGDAGRYIVPDGRDGQICVVDIMMTGAQAKKAAEIITHNPGFVRRLVEDAVIRSANVTAEVWHKGDKSTNARPLRPPYEEWDSHDAGGKMHYQEVNESGKAPSRIFDVRGNKEAP